MIGRELGHAMEKVVILNMYIDLGSNGAIFYQITISRVLYYTDLVIRN